MMRGLDRVPRVGERQFYRDRVEWRWYQKFVPQDLRVEGAWIPQEEWWEHNGHTIHLDRYAHPEPRATVVLVHGGGGNGRVLGPFARMALRAGCEVVAPDFPGYGLTVRSRARAARPSYRLWSSIAAALIKAERDRTGRPVIVWGLSIGGLLAYMAAAEGRGAAGVIATTLADTRRLPTMAKVGRNAIIGGGGYLFARLLGPLLNPIRMPMKWLAPMELISNDPDVSRVFMRDRLAGGSIVSMYFLRSLMNARPALEPEEFDVCPVLLAHPAIDPWTPLELSRQFFDRLRGPKELVVLEGAGHFPVEEPGRNQLESAVTRFVDRIVTGGTANDA